MRTTVSRRYTFEACHHLIGVPASHKCAKPHGHSYKVEVTFAGTVHPRTGFVIDFADIDRIVAPIVAALDHSNLNDHIPNSTAENIAGYFARLIRENVMMPREVQLVGVRIDETERGSAFLCLED